MNRLSRRGKGEGKGRERAKGLECYLQEIDYTSVVCDNRK